MNPEEGPVKADIYEREKKVPLIKFLTGGRPDTNPIPTETHYFNMNELVGYGQFPDLGIFGIMRVDGETTLNIVPSKDVFIKLHNGEAVSGVVPDQRTDIPLEGSTITIKSLQTGRRVVLSINDPDAEAIVGAKPIPPKPTLTTSVALVQPRAQHRLHPDHTRTMPGDKSDLNSRQY